MAIQKKFANKILMKNRIDHVNHTYFLLLKIHDQDPRAKKLQRRTQEVKLL